MIQSRVLFLTEQGLLFIKKKKPLQLCFYYLIWVVTSKQAVNGTIQAAKKASERKERVSEEKEEKWPQKATLFLCKHKHLIEASQKQNGWLRMRVIKSHLNVAKSSTCFLNSTLMFANRA